MTRSSSDTESMVAPLDRLFKNGGLDAFDLFVHTARGKDPDAHAAGNQDEDASKSACAPSRAARRQPGGQQEYKNQGPLKGAPDAKVVLHQDGRGKHGAQD